MKILYIGHYRENSGWAEFAKNHILALDSIGVDVVPRYIKLNDQWNEAHPRISELEKKSAEGCDIIIQCVLPHHYQYQSGAKNIGIYFTETSDFTMSSWPAHINMMDEAWVSNRQMIKVSEKSGVIIPIKQVPPALDISKYEAAYVEWDDLKSKSQNDFLFYFIGDFRKRKNLSAVIKAFHLEFGPHEAASLVIKAGKYGVSSKTLLDEVSSMTAAIKNGLRLYPSVNHYKGEIVITEHLTDSQINGLHATCDCLVAPSYGEALGLVVLDAMGFGNLVVASDVGGPAEFLEDKTTPLCGFRSDYGYRVDTNEEICFGVSQDTFPFLMTSHETWRAANIASLRKCMRGAYILDKNTKAKMKSNTQNKVKEFNYERTGRKIIELLES